MFILFISSFTQNIMRVGVIDSLWGFWEEEEKWVELWDILRTLNEDIVGVDG